MRVGPLEIALIVIVVMAIAVIARIARLGHVPARERGPGGRRVRLGGFLNKAGIVLVIGGVALFAAAAGLFRWALQGYLWAFILIAGGIIMVLLARRRA